MTVLSMVPNDTPFLPPKVTDVAKETLRNFPHSKKVGNYLLGNTLGEGSFAKVKEALHIPTGERVRVFFFYLYRSLNPINRDLDLSENISTASKFAD